MSTAAFIDLFSRLVEDRDKDRALFLKRLLDDATGSAEEKDALRHVEKLPEVLVEMLEASDVMSPRVAADVVTNLCSASVTWHPESDASSEVSEEVDEEAQEAHCVRFRNVLVSAGIMAPLSKLIRERCADEVATDAALALGHICQCPGDADGANRAPPPGLSEFVVHEGPWVAAREAGASEPLVALLRMGLEAADPSKVSYAALALGNLACNEIVRATIISAGGVAALAAALHTAREGKDDDEEEGEEEEGEDEGDLPHRRAADALAKLVLSDVAQRAACESGAVPWLVAMARSRSELVQSASADALAALTSLQLPDVCACIRVASGIAPLVDLLLDPLATPFDSAAAAIANLCTDEESVPMIVQAGASSRLLHACPTCNGAALDALANLAAAAGDDLVSHGAVGVLLSALSVELGIGALSSVTLNHRAKCIATILSNLVCTPVGANAVVAGDGIRILRMAGDEGEAALRNLQDHATDSRATRLLEQSKTKAQQPKKRRRT